MADQMTDIRTVAGSSPVTSATLVQADQESIAGDGSRVNPLHVVEGSVEVLTDETTLLGNGTPGNPLRASPSILGIPTIAAGIVNADGTFLSQAGFSTISHPGPGKYSLQLTSPPADASLAVPVATILSASVPGQIVFILTVGGLDVTTFDGAGSPTDRIFSVIVGDLT